MKMKIQVIDILSGIWPAEVRERDFFTPRGEFKVDHEATPTMRNSMFYKLSYYRFASLFPPGQAVDRVRQATIPSDEIELNVVEEAFTTTNWMIRLYAVKKDDNIGRTLHEATSFAKGNKRRKAGKRKGPRSLRVE